MALSKYARKTGIRRSGLFVIAAEGHKTEAQYFDGLCDKLEQSNIKIKVLNRPDSKSGHSHCSHLYNQLNDYCENNNLRSDDVLCLVMDRDKQSTKPDQLADMKALCSASGFLMVLSNSTFELWLMLHYIDEISEENVAKIKENEKGFMKSELKSIVGSYNPSKLDFEAYWPHIETACERARTLDPGNDWLDPIGTHVYKIIDPLLPTIKECCN